MLAGRSGCSAFCGRLCRRRSLIGATQMRGFRRRRSASTLLALRQLVLDETMCFSYEQRKRGGDGSLCEEVRAIRTDAGLILE